MPSEKTKKLLEGLGKITDSAPKRFQQEKFHSYTNRYYPNTINPMPSRYDKAKRIKDEDGEEYFMIDRVYGSLYGQTLMQKDGTEYKGKLYNKRRLVTHNKNSFYSKCTVTADGRWFDNGGMPIEAPTKLEPEKVKTQEEIEEEQREKEEKAKAKEAAILANLK